MAGGRFVDTARKLRQLGNPTSRACEKRGVWTWEFRVKKHCDRIETAYTAVKYLTL
jgi:hypothetical protein